MSMTSEQLQFLADKGLSFADAIEFARMMETQKPRSANAERQQRYRDNKRNATRNVTPPIDNNHTPNTLPIEPNGSIAPRGRKPKSNRRLPDDWQPEPLTAETLAMVQLWEPGRLERELAKFRDYWKSASGRKASKDDWQAAWRFWLRNSDDWDKGNGTSNRASYQSGKPVNGFAAALRHIADGPPVEPFGIDR
jgi:hypothetical protein